MASTAPLVTVPVSFFDARSGVSALAIQHLHSDGRRVIVYHDAPAPPVAIALLAAVAESLVDEMPAGQVLSLVETSMPEHPAETFVYAPVTLWHSAPSGGISAASSRTLGREAVARLCGITPLELERTEQLVTGIHRRRECAFAGFPQLTLGGRARRLRVVA